MAKSSKADALGPTDSNVSDDTIALHYTAISGIKAKQRKLSGDLSQAFARAEADGIDKEAFQLLIKARAKDDPDRVVTMFRKFGDYAVATNAAFATQGELFGGGSRTTRASGLSARAKASLDEHDGDVAGYGAGKAGRSRDDNPHELGSRMSQVWMEGWLRGQGDNATPNTRTVKLRAVEPGEAPELSGGSKPRRGRKAADADAEADTGPKAPPMPDGDPGFDDGPIEVLPAGAEETASAEAAVDAPAPQPRSVDVRNALVQRAKAIGVKNASRASSAELEAAVAAAAH